MEKHAHRFWLPCIICVAAILRILVVIFAFWHDGGMRGFYPRDSIQYLLPARELLANGTFTIEHIPHLVRTPGYPLLLLPGIALGHVTAVTILLQIVLGCATVWIIFLIGKQLFSTTIPALIGAALYAIEPLAVIYSAEIVTETLFTFALVCCIYCMIIFVQKPALRPVVFGAGFCALCAYIRPVGCYLPIVLAIGALAVFFSAKTLTRRKILQLFLFMLLSEGIVFAWNVRNGVQTGYWGFSSIKELSLYYYQAASVHANVNRQPYLTIQQSWGYDRELLAIEHPSSLTRPQAEHFRVLGDSGRSIIIRHPLVFAKIWIAGMVRVWIDPGGTTCLSLLGYDRNIDELIGHALDNGMIGALGYFARERPLMFWTNLLLGFLLVGYYLCAIAGIVSMPPGAKIFMLLLLAVIAYFAILSGGANAVSRFRHPIMPLICIFAGCGVWRAAGKLSRGYCAPSS